MIMTAVLAITVVGTVAVAFTVNLAVVIGWLNRRRTIK
jgi:hypothetical protein